MAINESISQYKVLLHQGVLVYNLKNVIFLNIHCILHYKNEI